MKYRLIFCLASLWWGLCFAQNWEGRVVVLTIDGAIGPAVSDYVVQGIEKAEEQQAAVIILQMDTPGGLDTSMRQMIRAILASSVPVVAYVAPSGARAASAGTYILYASHLAAMAPGTNLGAATPVQIGGIQPLSPHKDPLADPSDPKQLPQLDKGVTAEPDDAGKPDTKTSSAMEHKLVNDASAYLRSLARLRGRNAQWAESAVRDAASLSAQEALDKNVIELIARDIDELIALMAKIPIPAGSDESRLVEINNVTPLFLEPTARQKFLAVITNPNIAYILMLLGIYGLIFELANPGSIVPGVIGGIALLLALFAFQMIPVNYAGLALIILGLMLMLAEVFVPSFGALGIGGATALVVGTIMLMDQDVPGFGLSLSLVLSVAAISVVAMMALLGMVWQARRRPLASEDYRLTDSLCEVLPATADASWVRCHGERWMAQSSQPLQAGQQVRVRARRGLVLDVEPAHIKSTKS